MASVGDNIRTIRLTKGLTMAALAKAINTTHDMVSRWESGERHPKLDVVLRIAKVLRVSPGDIDPRLRTPPPTSSVVQLSGLRTVPVYGFGNAAPSRGEILGDVMPDSDHHLDRVATVNGQVVAAFRVSGQSMDGARIYDGDIVQCVPVHNPREIPQGAIVVCKVADNLYCKKWRHTAGRVLLLSAGAENGGKDLEVREREIEWVLRVVHVGRDLNGAAH